ncbi:FeoA family protein [Thiococcus pfennigii]|uniref:FeoA family protein n=1 Tax=Thiococcus pfennigii TaxID=1057 RepID=UPI0019079F9C|nr:FeoA family protein [Thiococcus pfennigii]MBK1699442.1 ferrous iron transport protein A [Thiococcus pfennigii]MBK1732906.1 ferrous iron transport protein A [Thiococcus pfennigii]
MTPNPDRPVRTLNDFPPGRRVRIHRLLGHGAVRQRLMDLGLMPGIVVTVVRSAPLDDPIQVMLDTNHVTLRRHEAAAIEVSDEGPAGRPTN